MLAWLERVRRRRRTPNQTVLASLDVTAAAALCEQIIAASPDCVKVLDTSARLTWMNAAGCRLMEIDDFACVEGRHWLDFWAGAERGAAKVALAAAQAGGVGRFTGACPTLAGHLKWWNVIVIPISAGPAPRPVVSISRDVSDLVAAAEARAALGTAERTARSDAQDAEARRTDLLATVSHEMRAPLQTILSWAVLLQRQRPGDNVEAARRIEEAARDQLELCERMLASTSATATSGFVLTPLMLHELVTDVTASAEALAAAKRITVTARAKETAWVAADAHSLRQALLNLVSNAVKFTPPRGTITIELTSKTSHCVISVSDTGRGIAPPFQPKLFQRYSQEEPHATPTAAGVGLGLYLARRIVEAHAGTISCTSEGRGCGATFSVTLPRLLDSRATKLVSSSRSTGGDLSGIRIAMVTGSSAGQPIAASLRDVGAHVRLQQNDAPLCADDPWVHGLIVDIGDHEALSVIQHVRRHQARPLWIIAMTDAPSAALKSAALAAGCNEVVKLPVRPRSLARVVAELQARHRERTRVLPIQRGITTLPMT